MMSEPDVAVSLDQRAKPYGWIGLPLSLVGIVVLGLALGLCVVGLGFGLDVVAVGLGAAWLRLQAMLSGLQRDPESSLSRLVLFSLSILIYLTTALAIVVFARLRGGAQWRDLVGWHSWAPQRASRSFWVIVGVTLLFSLAANEALSLYYPPSQDWVTLPKGTLAVVLFLILASACAPLTEELFFRGWLYTALRAKLGPSASIAISAVLFALAHYEQTLLYALAVFPVGIALGLVRERESSLKASITFHAIFNTVAFGLLVLGT